MTRATAFLLCALALTQRAGASDDVALDLPPWRAHHLPAWAESVRIIKDDQPLRNRPAGSGARRGSVARDALLPLFGARPGPGCAAPWLHVGPRAWTCGDDVQLSGRTPMAAGESVLPRHAGLPFRYYFAGRDGSLAYRRLDQVDWGEPHMRLEPGFAVAIVDERVVDGQHYGRTNRGLWVPMRDFGPARTFDFEGATLEEDVGEVLPVAWVVTDEARLYHKSAGGFAPTAETLPRFAQVGYFESERHWSGRYARIDDARWVRTEDVRHPTVGPLPDEPEVRHGARWIDIELESQTLVAYEGDRPVFATLVSTGKGRTKGHPFETPEGVHRIWVKLLSTTMDNLEDDTAGRYWRIEDVPYVQFFHEGVGLHGAFWHRSFGHVRSHGCVNLAPYDAKRLFEFTRPNIPAGWTAALPTDGNRGTIVRVR